MYYKTLHKSSLNLYKNIKIHTHNFLLYTFEVQIKMYKLQTFCIKKITKAQTGTKMCVITIIFIFHILSLNLY